jgi:hypothetical protein
MRRLLLGLLTAVLLVSTAAADDVEVNLTVDRTTVQLGQELRLTVEVSGKGSGVGEPTVEGLEAFRVMSTGSSHSFSLSGGGLQSSTTFTYRIVPTQDGTFQIGPARLVMDGKTYLSQSVKVDVSTAPVPREEEPSAPARGRGAAFLASRVDVDTAYVNQQITLSVLLYSRTQFLDTPRYSPPSLSGFWTEDLGPQLTYRATIGGHRYDVVEVRTALFPTSPGEYTIGPATVEMTIPDQSARDPFASPFFRGFFPSGRKRVLRSEPLSVVAIPLPAHGKPQQFEGAVGRFTIRSSLDRSEVEENEPVTLTSVVEGTGNLRSVPEPLLAWPDELRRYPAKAEVKTTKENYRIGGRKSFETVLVPTTAGSFTLPGPRLSFFDPATGAYDEAVAASMPLVVAPAPPGSLAAPTPVVGGVTLVGKDIAHIRTSTPRWTRARGFPKAPGGWPIHATPVALVAVGLAWRAIGRAHASSQSAKRRRAAKAALRRIRKARRQLRGEEWRNGVAEIAGALDDYLGQKLGLEKVHLTADRLARELGTRGLSADLLAETLGCRDACDRARFVPGASAELASDIADRAERLIRRLGDQSWW